MIGGIIGYRRLAFQVLFIPSSVSSSRPGTYAMGLDRKTYSVTEAGKILGIGRSAAYEAARRGELPVVRIGRRLLVPIRALERMLETAGRLPAAPDQKLSP